MIELIVPPDTRASGPVVGTDEGSEVADCKTWLSAVSQVISPLTNISPPRSPAGSDWD